MTGDTFSFLLCRETDLLIAEVELTGMDRKADTGDGMTRLRTLEGARLRMVLPPQAIAEMIFEPGPAQVGARLSGPSSLCFTFAAGLDLPLTVEGVLTLLALHGQLEGTTDSSVQRTLIEAPWGLFGSLLPRGSQPVRSSHAVTPTRSPAGAVGLWQARLASASGMRLLGLAAREDALPTGALNAGQRSRIVLESRRGMPNVSIAFGSLGATAGFELTSETFEWSHALTQGRDARVRVLSRGMLYPYGHRAMLVETTERVVADAAGGPVAGLAATETRLVVLERLRGHARLDFPFERTELLVDSAAIRRSHDIAHVRQSPVLAAHVDALRSEMAVLGAELDAELEVFASARTEEDLAAIGFGDMAALLGQRQHVANLQADLDAANAQHQDETQVPLAPGVIERLQNQLRAETPVLAQLEANVAVQVANIPRSKRQMRDQQHLGAVRFFELEASIAVLTAGLAAGIEVAFLPQVDLAGGAVEALRVPIRCQGALGPLEFDTALVFVHDITLTAAEHLEDFRSLDDDTTLGTLAEMWRVQAEIALPGVMLDLVRGSTRQPGDVHEVHGLRIECSQFDGSAYAPRLARIDARLAAWRLLLPDRPDSMSLQYEFGGSPDIVLRLNPPLPLDFTGHAERAGGLVVPRFSVDRVSRQHGAVPSAGTEAGSRRIDPRRVFADTTLLGLPLLALLADPEQLERDSAAALVPQPLAGDSPGARLEWPGLRLRDNGIFAADAESLLDVEVRATPEGVTTACTISSFGLHLPTGRPLLELDIDRLSFRSATGRPPTIGLEGLRLRFGHELQLLNGLQQKLQQGLDESSGGLVLQQRPDGIRAGYAVTIPEAESGGFVMRNAHASVTVDVPFTGRGVTVSLAFARPDNPFALTVLTLGGGGYILVEIGAGGLSRVDVSLEFGAMIAVDFRIAAAEVHALGGVTIRGDDSGVSFAAFIRLGGSVELLGVVSVSIELKLVLAYDDDDGANRLFGRATLVIDIDLLFFSETLELDSGEWVLAGSPLRQLDPADGGRVPFAGVLEAQGDLRMDADAARASWLAYQEAFSA